MGFIDCQGELRSPKFDVRPESENATMLAQAIMMKCHRWGGLISDFPSSRAGGWSPQWGCQCVGFGEGCISGLWTAPSSLCPLPWWRESPGVLLCSYKDASPIRLGPQAQDLLHLNHVLTALPANESCQWFGVNTWILGCASVHNVIFFGIRCLCRWR